MVKYGIDEISKYVRRGAKTFLWQEYRIIFIFIILIFALLFIFNRNFAYAFLLGSIFSVAISYIGMMVATKSNAKVVKSSAYLKRAFRKAFLPGLFVAIFSAVLAILGILSIYYLTYPEINALYCFAFGASFIALFMRVGGGIFTKAADISADLVGKYEKNLPEDSPENPAVIADLVGDNVGGVAGMSSDLFESFTESIVAAMIIAFLLSQDVLLPVKILGIGIVVSLFVVFIPIKKLHRTLTNYFVFGFVFISIISILFFEKEIFLPVFSGLVVGLVTGISVDYYTSFNKKPTRKIAEVSKQGASLNVLQGLVNGMLSVFFPLLIICIAIFFSYLSSGVYGIALSAIGMLSLFCIVLASDIFGPIVDNAEGISEICKLKRERQITERLDEAGNTTAAIGKGFAIGSAALTALALITSYALIANVSVIDLLKVKNVISSLFGCLIPFIFSALIIGSVRKTSESIIPEIRKQIKSKKIPDYNSVIRITTKFSLRGMILPAIISVLAPVIIGFVLGKEALGSFLLVSLGVSFVVAVFMANAGASLDNAKKYIEGGKFGGKGSEAHKASVIGDTVGDPLKDSAGPSLNILIKIMAVSALVFAILF